MPAITCVRCNVSKETTETQAGTPALIMKWTRVDGDPVCPKCKDPVSVRNYVYAAKPPTSDDLCQFVTQMRLAARMRNSLVEVERTRRTRTDEVLTTANAELTRVDAEIATTEAELEASRTNIRRDNSTARKKTTGTAAQKATIAGLKLRLATARDERKKIRKEMFDNDETKVVLAGVEEEAKTATKRVYADYGEEGLYWGSRVFLLDIHARTRKGPPPEFVPFRGDGHVVVQLQGGLTAQEAMGCEDTQLRIEVLHDRPKKPHAIVHIRTGSTDKGRPIWSQIRICFHRPLPAGCLVKGAHVVRRREGYRDHWSVMLSVAGGERIDDRADTGTTVGVDVGWRKLKDGRVRVAAVSGSDGHEEELTIPAWQVEARLKADDINSIRDKLFDKVLAHLVEWTRTHPLPETWTTVSETNKYPIAANLAAWESQARLRRLVMYWRDNRFSGDEEVFGDVEAWRGIKQSQGVKPYVAAVKAAAEQGLLQAWLMREEHLCEYATGLVRRAITRRTEMFRLFSAKLRRRYTTAVVEDVNWRDEVLKKPTAEADDQADYIRKLHRVASPGALVRVLTEQMRACVRVPAAGTTTTCNACKAKCEFDAAKELTHTCESCGVEWDQDFNAARNLLTAV